MSEHELSLVNRARDGCRDALDELFLIVQSGLVASAKEADFIPRMDVDERISHAYFVFARAWSRYEYRDHARFATYMSACVKRSFLDEYRRRKRKCRRDFYSALALDCEYTAMLVEYQSFRQWRRSGKPGPESLEQCDDEPWLFDPFPEFESSQMAQSCPTSLVQLTLF